MPVVPFSRQPNGLPEDLQPSEGHLMMAAATMHAMGRLQTPSKPPLREKFSDEEKKMEGRQRHQDLVNPDEQIGKIKEQEL